MELRFIGYRRPFQVDFETWSASDREQLEDICHAEGFVEFLRAYAAKSSDLSAFDDCELRAAELVDVVAEDGAAVYNLYFWDYGTAFLYAAGTTEQLGGACQHGFELEDEDEDVMQALGVAYAAADPPIEQKIEFEIE